MTRLVAEGSSYRESMQLPTCIIVTATFLECAVPRKSSFRRSSILFSRGEQDKKKTFGKTVADEED